MDHSAMPRVAKIEWLLLDKFSDWSSEDLLTKASNEFIFTQTDAYWEYSEFLYNLPEAELDEIFLQRLADRHADARRGRLISDAILFFNKPGAFADFTFWSKQLTWTIEQTIALSLARDPDRVNSKALLSEENDAADSAFAREYIARLRIASSFEEVGQLAKIATPGERLAWLHRAGLCVPDELTLAVQQMGHRIADWQSEYHNLAEENAKVLEQLREVTHQNEQWQKRCADLVWMHRTELEERDGQIHEIRRERDDLVDQLSELPDNTEQVMPRETEGKPDIRRYNSALRMIFAMAKQKYHLGKEGERGRSTATLIESAANLSGVDLSPLAPSLISRV